LKSAGSRFPAALRLFFRVALRLLLRLAQALPQLLERGDLIGLLPEVQPVDLEGRKLDTISGPPRRGCLIEATESRETR